MRKSPFVPITGRDPLEDQERWERKNTRPPDLIAQTLGCAGYLANYRVRQGHQDLVFDRFYWGRQFLLDRFEEEGEIVEKEIKSKQDWANRQGYRYLPVRKGQTLTVGKLEEFLRGS